MNLKHALKLAVGLLILFFVFYRIGFARIWETLITVNLWVIPLIILVKIFFVLISALQSWILLRPISKMSYFEFLSCYMPSWSLGLFVPGKIGEASIIYFLKKKGISVGQATAVFVVEKVITLIVLSAIASFGFFVFFSFDVALKLIGLLVMLGVIGLFALLSNSGRKLMLRLLPKKYHVLFTGFGKTVYGYEKSYKLILFSSAASFLRWTLVSVFAYLVYLIGFGISIKFYMILLIVAIGTIVGLIPVSVNGLGIREGTSLYLYSLIGVPVTIVASMQVIHLTLLYTTGVIGGLFWRR